jgi:hypothetical protein
LEKSVHEGRIALQDRDEVPSGLAPDRREFLEFLKNEGTDLRHQPPLDLSQPFHDRLPMRLAHRHHRLGFRNRSPQLLQSRQ